MGNFFPSRSFGACFTSGAFARGNGGSMDDCPTLLARGKIGKEQTRRWRAGFRAPYALRALAIAINHGVVDNKNADVVEIINLAEKANIGQSNVNKRILNKACKLAKTFYSVRYQLANPVGANKKELDVSPEKQAEIARVTFTNVQYVNNANDGTDARVCINGKVDQAFNILRKVNVPVTDPTVVGEDGAFTTDLAMLCAKFGADVVDGSNPQSSGMRTRVTAIA